MNAEYSRLAGRNGAGHKRTAGDQAPPLLELDGAAEERLGLRGPLLLKRSWPKRAGHTALEYIDATGMLAPGQWFADRGACLQMARSTRRAAGDFGQIAVVAGDHILLQLGGADRKLIGLAPLLARPRATLVVHRPERRAVVRLEGATETRYAKVVPPERAAALAGQLAALQQSAGSRVRIPHLRELDPERGVVVMSALPGRSVHALLDDPALPDLMAAGGRALAALHGSAPPDGTPEHTAADEQAVVAQWLGRVAEYAPLVHSALWAHLPCVAAPLAMAGGPSVLLHRDFYDKQIIAAGDGSVGLLDFDTLATGEAALDLANALVHLELRSIQRGWPVARARRAAAGLLHGYRPDSATMRRLPVYADATRLRLACVYALRPAEAATVPALLNLLGTPIGEL